MPAVLKRIEDGGGWIPCDFESGPEDHNEKVKAAQAYCQEEYELVWQQSIGALIEPATAIIQAMNDGLEHAALQLEIIPRPGTKNFLNWLPGAKRTEETDREAQGESIKPGNPEFSKLLEEKLNDFSTGRIEALTAWAESRGLSKEQVEKLQSLGEFDVDEDPDDGQVRRDRQQLYLLLYIQHMVSTNRCSDVG